MPTGVLLLVFNKEVAASPLAFMYRQTTPLQVSRGIWTKLLSKFVLASTSTSNSLSFLFSYLRLLVLCRGTIQNAKQEFPVTAFVARH